MVSRWLLGPPDWAMAGCDVDLRDGGALRYVWRHADGAEMGLRGAFRAIDLDRRLVHTEPFDQGWTGGETIVTTTFTQDGGGTSVRHTVLCTSNESRGAVTRSGIERGIAAGDGRLDGMLEAEAAASRANSGSPIEIVNVETRLVAVVRRSVPLSQMATAQRQARSLLGEALEAADVRPSGPNLTIWRLAHDGAIDYAPGVFVQAHFETSGDVSLMTLPEGRAAHLRLPGPYDRLATAWRELFDACERQGFATAGVNWEIYTSPMTAASTEIETDLYALLA